MPKANCLVVTLTYDTNARVPRRGRGKSFRDAGPRCKSFRWMRTRMIPKSIRDHRESDRGRTRRRVTAPVENEGGDVPGRLLKASASLPWLLPELSDRLARRPYLHLGSYCTRSAKPRQAPQSKISFS